MSGLLDDGAIHIHLEKRVMLLSSRRPAASVLIGLVILGGIAVMHRSSQGAEPATGPRAAAWGRVQQALDEGKPKTALESLAGIEQAAIQEKAWAEAARAIATRILAETGDRPGDDPERVIRLAAAIDNAPAETRGVLQAIRANWTWGYFQANRWRYQQRTPGSVPTPQGGADLAKLAEWDLPTIVAEIRSRFATAVGATGSAERTLLQSLPVADWSLLIEKGTQPDAYRPTVWDVVVRNAIEFAASGERGLVDPEDAFELVASSPALGTLDEFLAWKPETDAAVTDTAAPVLDTLRLYRELIAFHAADADKTALLSADLDRILWAAGAAVPDDGPETLAARKRQALEAFAARAGNHETAALATYHVAESVRDAGDLVAARTLAAGVIDGQPKSPGAAMCRNLIAEIEAKNLSLATERSWAAPWPAIRVSYRNLAKVHLRLVKADWMQRLRAGKQLDWFDDEDRAALLKLPAVREQAVDLPATPDFRERHEDVPVTVLDPQGLEPGGYFVIASARPDFGGSDNVVAAAFVRVTRLAIVIEQGGAGHVVNIATGEPVAGATVKAYVGSWDNAQRRQVFKEHGPTTTDKDGRFSLELPEPAHNVVIVASATLDGATHEAATDRTHVWQQHRPHPHGAVVLITDRGIHRPGQIVHYKGIVCSVDQAGAKYAAAANVAVDVVFRDANGREVAKGRHTTTANGSFHGNFPIATGALPGQWSIQAQAAGQQPAAGGVGVRVEEYKRPKFKVELAKPAQATPLGGTVTLTGTATTYTGLPVAGAKVAWRVERQVRWPIWCRWFFPWLPFDSGAQRIARGTAVSDANGAFTIAFPAKPDRSVPKDSLPVFTFAVTADVTDAGGETRSADQSVSVGYTDVEAAVTTDAWQAVNDAGEPAAVAVTVNTTTLDGVAKGATGTLTVSRLVQPAEVDRGSFAGPMPRPVPVMRGGQAGLPRPPEVDPANPDTWAAGEAVLTEKLVTDAATGKTVATAKLPAGIYRAVFSIPAAGDVPAVKAEQVIEVLDPRAERYGVKRALALIAPKTTVEPLSDYTGLIGTGYDRGRAFVEISQAGKVLERFWTQPGRTQWPVTFKVAAEHRGGFTVRTWMVRDGRLHDRTQVVDVPWTDKKLAVSWERFTRRLEPAAKEVWRAKIVSVADPVAGPAAPVQAELLALLYDQSLDALAAHDWPAAGLAGLFRSESGPLPLAFTNSGCGLAQLLWAFDVKHVDVPELTYRQFREPFGPQPWGMFGGRPRLMRGGRMMAERGIPMPAVAMAADAAVADEAPTAARREKSASNAAEAGKGSPPPRTGGPAAAPPPPRKNLVETAFFLPALSSDKEGNVTIEFTVPDTLTTWQFKALAHDAALRSGTLVDTCVSAKDLMVEPLMPRFLREGDVVQIPVKVSNKSTGRLTGTVTFALFDARTDASRDDLVEGKREQAFDLAAGESKPAVFTVKVADGTDALRYLATGRAGTASDGEEAMIPVLPRRVLVTETVPVTIRGPGERAVSLDRLAKSAGTDIQSQSLVVQAASNPAWYAVLALPAIMEQTDESTETLFTRLYANTLAHHLATRDPRIAKVFEQWKGTDALTSPLEKNTDLVKTLLAETPWVRDAVDETEARARIALLFDATRADNEAAAALQRLAALRNGDGGWPWFSGGQTCDSVTLGIIAGFGRLRAAGVKLDVQPALEAIPWLDGRLVEERTRAKKSWGDKPDDVVLTPIGAYALYARSFFRDDAPPQGEAAGAIRWGLDVAKRNWAKLDGRMTQGHAAIALVRAGERETALSIVDSLKQRAVDADVQPGAEKDSWQGMWWRDPHPGWWSWNYAPIATQTIMIEAFDEVAGDAASVEALKVWLLSQKRTSQWPGSRATADAVSALLGRGTDLLASQELVEVTIGGERIEPVKVEAGTGFFEERLVRREITPQAGAIRLVKKDAGLAWGGVHWQYLDDIANVPAAGREELAIEKQLFVKRFTKAGPELVPIAGAAGVTVEPGDELVVRLVVTSDRDYQFLELADHRPSLTEPVDVLSGWRWGDGAGWYVAIRDASTQLFFERLPRGTHVFEYSLRAAHRGTASSGFATIRSRYAPEFSAHSASVNLEVQ
ncbi:MAG: hypothetical protein RLZZ21_1478 [Planctomycetota bacterium]